MPAKSNTLRDKTLKKIETFKKKLFKLYKCTRGGNIKLINMQALWDL